MSSGLVRPAIGALAGVVLLVAAWLVPLPAPAPGGPPVSSSVDAPSPPALPALAQLGETIARPLFSPARRPIPGQAAAPARPDSAAALFNRYRLQGVVIDGDRRRVLLAPAPNGRTISVGEGDTVDGWTIDRIAPERLTLRSGARVETVELGTVTGR